MGGALGCIPLGVGRYRSETRLRRIKFGRTPPSCCSPLHRRSCGGRRSGCHWLPAQTSQERQKLSFKQEPGTSRRGSWLCDEQKNNEQKTNIAASASLNFRMRAQELAGASLWEQNYTCLHLSTQMEMASTQRCTFLLIAAKPESGKNFPWIHATF